MARINYTEEQITTLLAHAQEVGLGRAIRDLGYPSYPCAMRWAETRGVSLDVDPVKQKAARTHQWYKDEEKLLVCQEGIQRIQESLTEDTLTPDDINKLANALKKYIETMALVEGKPTSITQDNGQDETFKKMLEEFNVSSRVLPVEEER